MDLPNIQVTSANNTKGNAHGNYGNEQGFEPQKANGSADVLIL